MATTYVEPPVPIPPQPDPDGTLYFPELPPEPSVFGPDAGGYQLWKCWARTRGRSGWRLMPAAGDDSQQDLPCRKVKLSAGWTRITVFYRVVRMGATPELPDPRPTDDNLVLLLWDDRAHAVPAPNGLDWLYEVRGKRVYGCTMPAYGWVEGLLVPVPPLSSTSKGSLDVPATAFVRDIV